MGADYYNSIKTNIKYISHIQELLITETPNEHAQLFLTGMIGEKYSREPDVIVNSVLDVTVGDEKPFFYGRAVDVKIRREENIYILEVTAKSYSYLMDTRKKQRSFQNESMTYQNLFDEVMKEYPRGYIEDNVSKGKKISGVILQYNETDWEFIKRMASHFNSRVSPVCGSSAPVLEIGCPRMRNLGKLENFNYRITKDIEGYERLEAAGSGQITETDMLSYEIWDYENYELRSNVIYQDKVLYVKEKITSMEKGIIVYHYKLAGINGFPIEKQWNHEIQGVSLQGKVIAVDKDLLKLHLKIDKLQDAGTAKYFQYTTMYSSSGNAGWYCMPELGDMVNLYFPSRDEASAVAVNSIRTDDRAIEGLDASTKILRTADGKEIKFFAGGIKITCSNAANKATGEKNITYIELNENDGIKIFSTKPVSIHSDEDLSLSTGKQMHLSADEEICLKCKTSQIVINEAVDIAGKIVKIN